MNIDEKEAAELVAALKQTLAKVNDLLDRLNLIADRLIGKA